MRYDTGERTHRHALPRRLIREGMQQLHLVAPPRLLINYRNDATVGVPLSEVVSEVLGGGDEGLCSSGESSRRCEKACEGVRRRAKAGGDGR